MTLAGLEDLTSTQAEGLIDIDGAGFYHVPDVDRIPPFLMNVVSDGDRWMFVSSSGALTAGRVDASRALFPYETDDRIHRAAGSVGPATRIRVIDQGSEVWRPFHGAPAPNVRRSLSKSVVGDSVVFDETHPELGLAFRYGWTSSDRFGFIRTATLSNHSGQPIRADLVDGLLDLLPYGLDPSVYQRMSNLTNAYKRSEVLDAATRLATFSLESGVVDRPEPAEVLRCTVAWSIGLDGATVTMSPDAIATFEAGAAWQGVPLMTGRPGAYLLDAAVDLQPGESARWHIVADVAQDQVAVAGLRAMLESDPDLEATLDASLQKSSESLVEIMAPADALQRTGDRVATAHQFANVTYNVMRGGVPLSGYQISSEDFAAFVADRNRQVADRHESWLGSLPEIVERDELLGQVRGADDPQLTRLGLEYLPFSFARRHGDPSRPWNAFSIRVSEADGQPILYYEGNWRDIFQNWEALCMSFPEFLPSVISVFVDASTPDGFNPYRITRAGIDWEVPDPENPWSSIGYWGDHQIVYLLRLLEASDRFLTGKVVGLLTERMFSYADVPYRLASYEDMVRNPKTTIRFDDQAAARALGRVDVVGGDGRLLADVDGEVYLATLAEKLLVPALAKLSSFVPGGGIWMNTQRPEWNDANNALVGFGLSMVTLYQLRRYLRHLNSLIQTADADEVLMSIEVAEWLRAVTLALSKHPVDDAKLSDNGRKRLLDDLGTAFDEYRSKVYDSGFTGVTRVEFGEIVKLCDRSVEHLDETIRANRRSDGLYHSYNLVRFGSAGSEAAVEPLFEMLEGQVAVLESGVLSPEQRADLIDALFSSAMYRRDQDSFMLYPVRSLPSFLDKNVIPSEEVTDNPLLRALLSANDESVISVDVDGRFRFNADFSNQRDLAAALDDLESQGAWAELLPAHRVATLASYERVFGHHGYTGRSGSMYGYEGIGSIYWHMVAKLLVAVQESVVDATSAHASSETIERLVDAYHRVRSGLGFNKTSEQFGAIPTDPYSHTPAHAGAQQPGMTGLVKEELLTRTLEVGVRVANGEICIDPILMRRDELLDRTETWTVYDLSLKPRVIELGERSLGMTLCQVPIVVTETTGEPGLEVVFTDGTTKRYPGLHLDRDVSAQVFARSGEVDRIHGYLPHTQIRE